MAESFEISSAPMMAQMFGNAGVEHMRKHGVFWFCVVAWISTFQWIYFKWRWMRVTVSCALRHVCFVAVALSSVHWVILASESGHKGSNASSISSPVVEEGRLRPGHWLELVLCISFHALTLMVGWQERHLACTSTIPLILIGSLPEQTKEEDLRKNWLIQVHLENGHYLDVPGSVCFSAVTVLLINISKFLWPPYVADVGIIFLPCNIYLSFFYLFFLV